MNSDGEAERNSTFSSLIGSLSAQDRGYLKELVKAFIVSITVITGENISSQLEKMKFYEPLSGVPGKIEWDTFIDFKSASFNNSDIDVESQFREFLKQFAEAEMLEVGPSETTSMTYAVSKIINQVLVKKPPTS